jgi:hypothetical protein
MNDLRLGNPGIAQTAAQQSSIVFFLFMRNGSWKPRLSIRNYLYKIVKCFSSLDMSPTRLRTPVLCNMLALFFDQCHRPGFGVTNSY